MSPIRQQPAKRDLIIDHAKVATTDLPNLDTAIAHKVTDRNTARDLNDNIRSMTRHLPHKGMMTSRRRAATAIGLKMEDKADTVNARNMALTDRSTVQIDHSPIVRNTARIDHSTVPIDQLTARLVLLDNTNRMTKDSLLQPTLTSLHRASTAIAHNKVATISVRRVDTASDHNKVVTASVRNTAMIARNGATNQTTRAAQTKTMHLITTPISTVVAVVATTRMTTATSHRALKLHVHRDEREATHNVRHKDKVGHLRGDHHKVDTVRKMKPAAVATRDNVVTAHNSKKEPAAATEANVVMVLKGATRANGLVVIQANVAPAVTAMAIKVIIKTKATINPARHAVAVGRRCVLRDQ